MLIIVNLSNQQYESDLVDMLKGHLWQCQRLKYVHACFNLIPNKANSMRLLYSKPGKLGLNVHNIYLPIN